jgi:origin recognition complex subunit 4
VAQSARAPICVLGVTSRLDVIELLEKRVKSRFSHRQIFLLPKSDNLNEYLSLCESFLSLPEKEESKKVPAIPKEILQRREFIFLRRNFQSQKYSFDKSWRSSWNASVKSFLSSKQTQRVLRYFHQFDSTICALKNLLFQIVCELNEKSSKFSPDFLENLAEKISCSDDKCFLIEGLSVLEICLLISMKHHCEIYDRDPFNFEIILGRFNKFSSKSSSMNNMDREVALKAFEHLKVNS